jgi:hypothetical protein
MTSMYVWFRDFVVDDNEVSFEGEGIYVLCITLTHEANKLC